MAACTFSHFLLQYMMYEHPGRCLACSGRAVVGLVAQIY